MLYVSNGGGNIENPKCDDYKIEFEFRMLKNEFRDKDI